MPPERGAGLRRSGGAPPRRRRLARKRWTSINNWSATTRKRYIIKKGWPGRSTIWVFSTRGVASTPRPRRPISNPSPSRKPFSATIPRSSRSRLISAGATATWPLTSGKAGRPKSLSSGRPGRSASWSPCWSKIRGMWPPARICLMPSWAAGRRWFAWTAVTMPPRTGGGRSLSARANPTSTCGSIVLPHLALLGEHVQATAEVETLLAEGHVQGSNLSMFANVHSLCSAAAASDARLPPGRAGTAGRQVRRPGGRVAAQAQAAGYFQDPDRLARLKENKDLDAIRSRPDFQKLLVELEQKSGKKPTPE